jgi:hypothetical protein
MESPAGSAATYHVLLVGIDDYKERPLEGCVNDIDAVQRMLLGPRLGLARDRIRRLASPLPGRSGERRQTEVAEQPATLDNLRAALAALGTDRVSRGDRVFIYYSGHGMRVPVHSARGGRYFREALAPADVLGDGELRLLYDFELNELLRAIVARTRAVTLVLDCCHAASVSRDGATRSLARARTLPLTALGALGPGETLRDPADATDPPSVALPLALGVDDCHVVSACLGHQQTIEDIGPGDVPHGLFTSALLTALRPPEVDLAAVTWGRIWHAIRAEVERRNPHQDPAMFGNAGRPVLGGPPVEGDAGFTVTRPGSRHRIEAGALAGVTPGAVLAVYGEQPAYFPRLDSPEDHRARAGMLRVIGATPGTAVAEALEPFALPPGARARLVEAGKAARLRCASLPEHSAISEAIAGSRLLEQVAPEAAHVRLELADGRWLLTDDQHRAEPDAPVLFALDPWELYQAGALLEHYHAYARPLRMAALATDLAAPLELRVLHCHGAVRAPDAQGAAELAAVLPHDAHVYVLQDGAQVCFQVRNGSQHRLRVTLINAAASGRVQLLGDDVIDAGAFHRFWANSNLGAPFTMELPPGARRAIDRIVAIGTTAMERDLGHLRVDRSFADAIKVAKGHGKDLAAPPAPPPVERWTAAQVIVETRLD